MIPFNEFERKYSRYRKEILKVVDETFKKGWFILGPELQKFEEDFAKYLGVKFVVGVNSGTDALYLALRALGIRNGDGVITVANTATPTVSAIRMAGAVPIFADIDPETLTIDPRHVERRINPKVKAILPVHLFGYPANMPALIKLAKKHKVKLIEDVCQAHGAQISNKFLGTWGDIGCFSFYPTKNLGAFGDAGAIATNNRKTADAVKSLRNYGEIRKYYNTREGVNSRLDELQAAFLNWGLTYLDQWNKERESIARIYLANLKDIPLELPSESDSKVRRVWHLFVIRSQRRDGLKKYLESKGIQTSIHYPLAIYQQPAYSFLEYGNRDLPITSMVNKQILSLPLYPELTKEEVERVCKEIRSFYSTTKIFEERNL